MHVEEQILFWVQGVGWPDEAFLVVGQDRGILGAWVQVCVAHRFEIIRFNLLVSFFYEINVIYKGRRF